jgi:hypothetical protein
MARPGWHGVVAFIALIALFGGTGCYDWVAIKPADIPRFTAGQHELERPDGSHVQFDGQVAVKVHTADGTLTYWNPKASIEDGILAISGDTAPAAEIRLGAIDRAKAGQLNTIDTIATIVVSLAGAAVVGFLLYESPFFNFNSHTVE